MLLFSVRLKGSLVLMVLFVMVSWFLVICWLFWVGGRILVMKLVFGWVGVFRKFGLVVELLIDFSVSEVMLILIFILFVCVVGL